VALSVECIKSLRHSRCCLVQVIDINLSKLLSVGGTDLSGTLKLQSLNGEVAFRRAQYEEEPSLSLTVHASARSSSQVASSAEPRALWRKREVVRQEKTTHYTTMDADGQLQELVERETTQTEVLHMECRETGEFAHRETTRYEQMETFNEEVVAELQGTEEYVHLKSLEDEFHYMESTMPPKGNPNPVPEEEIKQQPEAAGEDDLLHRQWPSHGDSGREEGGLAEETPPGNPFEEGADTGERFHGQQGPSSGRTFIDLSCLSPPPLDPMTPPHFHYHQTSNNNHYNVNTSSKSNEIIDEDAMAAAYAYAEGEVGGWDDNNGHINADNNGKNHNGGNNGGNSREMGGRSSRTTAEFSPVQKAQPLASTLRSCASYESLQDID